MNKNKKKTYIKLDLTLDEKEKTQKKTKLYCAYIGPPDRRQEYESVRWSYHLDIAM